MDINQIIQTTEKLLKDNREWEDRYKNYIRKIGNIDQGKRSFKKPVGLSLYGSVSQSRETYILRFKGQSVATINIKKINNNNNDVKIKLTPSINNNKYFQCDSCKVCREKSSWDWKSKDARKFRSCFKKNMNEHQNIVLHSKEHTIENHLLKEFSKKSSKGKALCYIQPIKLHDLFFQMPTPLKASTHKPEYVADKGGGIDILARVKHSDNSSRICIMEVKDENKQKESQAIAMSQAVTYAVFIAYLLRSNSSQEWWTFFMEDIGRRKTIKKRTIPNQLDIDVVTIMPEGETEECCNKIFHLKDTNTLLHCHSLYYNEQVFKDKNELKFSGTYPEQLKQYYIAD